MSAADLLLPPSTYAWWVPVLGALALGIVAGWYFYVLRSTRSDSRRARTSMPASTAQRDEYVAKIDAAYGKYRAGESDLRALHLELAEVMRSYASLRIGRDVTTWTRRDVSEYDTTSRLGGLLAVWEEPSFAQSSDAEAEAAAQAATEVVRNW